MIYEPRPAPKGLDDAITRLWFLNTPPTRRYEKILPMPFAHAIITLSDPYLLHDRLGRATVGPDAFVSGLQSGYLVIESPATIRHLGIEFTPTGLSRFAPRLARTTADAVLDATSVLGDLTSFARARRLDSPDEALDALTALLLQLPRHPTDEVAIAAVGLIDDDTERPVGAIADELGIPHRALLDRFRRATGTTPKRHAQVVRFHRLVDAVHASGGTPEWSELAVAAGYYDQPHVIREFRRFSGWTPSAYFRLVAEHGPDAAHFVPLEHLPAQARS